MSTNDEPELVFEPIESGDEDERPPAPPAPKKPAASPPKPPPKPPAKAEPAAPPPPPKPVEPPQAVKAGAELREGLLQRDRRGRVVGERFAVSCANEAELLQALLTLSHIFPLAGLHWWTAPKAHLLEASAEGLAREMVSSRLDAAQDAFRHAGLRQKKPAEIRLFVGSRGHFVPYTGSGPAWDIAGDLPTATSVKPVLLGPGIPGTEWQEADKNDLLPRVRPRLRFRQHGDTRWLLVSRRIFHALHGFLQNAGLDFSFAGLTGTDPGEQVLVHVPELRRAEKKLLAGLPEVELLWDPQVDPEDEGLEPTEVPPLLIDRGHELPLGRETVALLATSTRPLIFRGAGPPLLLAGPLPLVPGDALLLAELAAAPQLLRLSEAPIVPLHLPLRLVRRGDDPRRRTRGLLLTASDLENFALLRDHLPWAITNEARLARFGEVAFLLLGREATWNLPLGLPYWGDDEAGMYLVRGYVASPEVPFRVLRRAAKVAEEEVGFLSPARLWCVPLRAFAPLAESLELQRDLSRFRLDVKGARFDKPPVFPELKWPEVKQKEEELPITELPPRPAAPARRRSLLEDAQDALARGDREKAAQLYERAGEYVVAARLYDQLAAEGADT